jgi:glycerol uptake facilitator protein
MQTALGEFVGMIVLILLGDGIVAGVLLERSKAKDAGWIAITTGWAIAVLMGILVAQALGAPGELNPAATLANVILGTRTVPDAAVHIAAQFLGAFVGATLVWLLYLAHWRETKDQSLKLAVFCNAPAIRATVPNLLSEIIATGALIFAANAAVHGATAGVVGATALGPTVVAALVWGVGLSLGGPTGYAVNPARDLGPRIAHAALPIAGKGGSDWSYAWIPVVGPFVGGALAAVCWGLAR